MAATVAVFLLGALIGGAVAYGVFLWMVVGLIEVFEAARAKLEELEAAVERAAKTHETATVALGQALVRAAASTAASTVRDIRREGS